MLILPFKPLAFTLTAGTLTQPFTAPVYTPYPHEGRHTRTIFTSPSQSHARVAVSDGAHNSRNNSEVDQVVGNLHYIDTPASSSSTSDALFTWL